MANKISMEENIRNYNDEIKSLKSFVEAVRKLPGMYIGRIGNKGFMNLTREIFQNSVDELMKKSSPCDRIKISYDEKTNIVIVEDNGRGIPFKSIVEIFTSEHTSSNYEKKDGEYSSGVHGVGSKVTNALSQWFIVESYILGEARRVEFRDGFLTEKGVQVIPNENNKQGTIVSFRPCYEVMGEISTTVQDVLGLVKLILPLTTIGSVIEFNGLFLDGSSYHESLVNEDGILTDLVLKTISPLIKPIIISQDTGKMKADIAFTYDSKDLEVENITSYSNFCPVQGGTHLDGFMDGICSFFRNYMNRIFLANNKKLSVLNVDIKTGLKAIVTVSHIQPMFTGQAKDVLGNEDMKPFVEELTLRTLRQWSKDNPQDLQRLCKYFKDIAEIRVKSEEGKVNLTKKYESSSLSGLPKKYAKPTGKKNLELLIVEGDSAAGSAKNSRCNSRQGLFPIRGKLPNALTTEKTKFLSNSEIAGIISIIGGGYGRSFDMSKVKWEKIIFMADGDADGHHINTLLLRFFLMYMPEMIKEGRVYRAIPPLFGLESKKNAIYFTDRLEYVQYCQKQFSKNNKICTVRGNNLSTKEITDLLYRNMDYVYDIEVLSSRYALNPNLLELILVNKDKSFSELDSIVKEKYRFCSLDRQGDSIIVKGLIDSKYQTLFLNDKFLKETSNILKYIDNNLNMYYNVNNEVISLYTLMKKFEGSTPNNITRYKGLGEMDPKQLAISTMHPDSEYRTLVRYTLESAKEQIDSIKYLESNKFELLKDVKVTRLDLIG